MKFYLKRLILLPMVLMSLSTGLAKIRLQEQELQFFEGIGLSVVLLILLGIVQVIGAGMTFVMKTRKYGAILMAIGFAISGILIFASDSDPELYIQILGYISLISAALSASLYFMRWDD